MCIMEIHPKAQRITMVQAITHNLSTVDRDLDMLGKLAESRNDGVLGDWVTSMQRVTHSAYALGLAEFGMEAAELASDANGHVHHESGNERTFEQIVNSATRAARKDETR